ncbi:MAG: methyltransferase domain-containing protein [Elusimicrobia bacterium]|nr:methyltransferase domain-containing protein [Elusimicrobiota bacterium]
MRYSSRCPVCAETPLLEIRQSVALARAAGLMKASYEEYLLKIGRQERPKEVLALCRGCHAGYRALFFDEAELGRIYDESYHALESRFKDSPELVYADEEFLSACARHLADYTQGLETRWGRPIRQVFDIGGRDGFRLVELAAAGRACRVYDPIAAPVRHPAIIKERRYAHQVPDGDQADLVILCNVLEHCLDPNAVVADCARLVADGGFLFIEIPDDMEACFDWYFFRRHRGSNLPVDLTHHVFFSRRSLAGLLARHGLTLVDLQLELLPRVGVRVLRATARKGVAAPLLRVPGFPSALLLWALRLPLRLALKLRRGGAQ